MRLVGRSTFVGSSLGATRFATIDPEEFFDFQSTRPQIRLVEGRHREITWPEVEIYEARVPRAPRDLVLLVGHEPSYRWRAFTRTIVELAEALGVQLVVTLGALLADVPHTRPVSITGLASDEALVERLGLGSAQLRGPNRDHRRPARRVRRGGHALGEPVGGRPALRRGRAQPEGRARPGTQARGPRRRLRRRLRAGGGGRATTSARSASPSRATRRRRPSSRSSRGAASEEEQTAARARLPSGDVLAREFQRFLRQRGPAERPSGQDAGPDPEVSAGSSAVYPARPPGLARSSPLLLCCRRADDAEVADRAGRVGRRGLEALAEDPVGDLRAPCR